MGAGTMMTRRTFRPALQRRWRSKSRRQRVDVGVDD
jgi:hypothetical protein